MLRRSLFITLGVAALVVATACEPLPQSADLPESAAHTPPANIDRTGATDVTQQLQAFLDRVPDGAKVLFPAGARYRIEGTLRLHGRDGLTLDGNGAAFFATQPTDGRTRSQWHLENVTNTVVEHMVIRGAHPNGGLGDDAYVAHLEAQHGINIVGGDRITVRHNTITDVYGDFVYVGRSARPVYGVPTQVRIHDNFLRRNGRSGISITKGDGVVIRANDIADVRRATFNMEPNTSGQFVRNVWIQGNRVGSGRLNFVAGGGAGTVDRVTVTDNVLTGKPMAMSFIARSDARRSNLHISGNVSDRNAGTPHGAIVRVLGYDDVIVVDNVQPMSWNRDMHMVEFRESCRLSVYGNELGPHAAGQSFVRSAGPC